MKILEKNINTVSPKNSRIVVEFDGFEMAALYAVARNVGGISDARNVFSDHKDSIVKQTQVNLTEIVNFANKITHGDSDGTWPKYQGTIVLRFDRPISNSKYTHHLRYRKPDGKIYDYDLDIVEMTSDYVLGECDGKGIRKFLTERIVSMNKN